MTRRYTRSRTDRNHIIYRLEHKATGDFYIGLSAVKGRALLGTLKFRFRKHVNKAFSLGMDWPLAKRLRKDPDPAAWEKEIVTVVRGRLEAHRTEQQLIRKHRPPLNTAVYHAR